MAVSHRREQVHIYIPFDLFWQRHSCFFDTRTQYSWYPDREYDKSFSAELILAKTWLSSNFAEINEPDFEVRNATKSLPVSSTAIIEILK